MNNTDWLPLIEYSNKHQISVSTLRRRIKDNSILFKLEDGKYFIVDDAVEKAPRGRKPIEFPRAMEEVPSTEMKPSILEEVKKAYMTALHSKEELIFQLKEEVSDLKTLVRVLESENERLRNENPNPPQFTNLNQY